MTCSNDPVWDISAAPGEVSNGKSCQEPTSSATPMGCQISTEAGRFWPVRSGAAMGKSGHSFDSNMPGRTSRARPTIRSHTLRILAAFFGSGSSITAARGKKPTKLDRKNSARCGRLRAMFTSPERMAHSSSRPSSEIHSSSSRQRWPNLSRGKSRVFAL